MGTFRFLVSVHAAPSSGAWKGWSLRHVPLPAFKVLKMPECQASMSFAANRGIVERIGSLYRYSQSNWRSVWHVQCAPHAASEFNRLILCAEVKFAPISIWMNGNLIACNMWNGKFAVPCAIINKMVNHDKGKACIFDCLHCLCSRFVRMGTNGCMDAPCHVLRLTNVSM